MQIQSVAICILISPMFTPTILRVCKPASITHQPNTDFKIVIIFKVFKHPGSHCLFREFVCGLFGSQVDCACRSSQANELRHKVVSPNQRSIARLINANDLSALFSYGIFLFLDAIICFQLRSRGINSCAHINKNLSQPLFSLYSHSP